MKKLKISQRNWNKKVLRMAASKLCFTMLKQRAWLPNLNHSLSAHLEPDAAQTLLSSLQGLELHKSSRLRDNDRAYLARNQILTSGIAVIRNGSSELELRAANGSRKSSRWRGSHAGATSDEPFQC